MESIDVKTITLQRELNELDAFVLKCISIIEKHCKYVLISGYVAILFGRTRTTEDVDLFIEKISREQFSALYQDLLQHGFWAINTDNQEELFSMLTDRLAIRFAERGKVIPNIELKFVKDKLDEFTLQERVKVVTKKGNLWISSIALQIAYKRFVLKSPKDLEDGQHLQKLFNINDETIKNYKLLLKQHGRL